MHMGMHSSVHVQGDRRGIAFHSSLKHGSGRFPRGGGNRPSPATAAGRVPAHRPGPACCCTQREVLVELEISAGAAIEAELRTLHADARQRAVTEHILAQADQAGYGAALIDPAARAEDSVITWPQFAHMVRAAARGLSRRGLQEGDTAGIFVEDAVSHAVAVHAVRAAGAAAAAVRPTRSAADIAAQLKQGRVRLLITSAGLADLAV